MTNCSRNLPNSWPSVPPCSCPVLMAAFHQVCPLCPVSTRVPCRNGAECSGISSAEAQEGEIMTFCWCSQTGGAIPKPASSAILRVFHQDNNPKISGIQTKKTMLVIPKMRHAPDVIHERVNFQTYKLINEFRSELTLSCKPDACLFGVW